MMDIFGLPWPLAVAPMATGAWLMLYGFAKAVKAEREWDAVQDKRLEKKCCGLWGGGRGR